VATIKGAAFNQVNTVFSCTIKHGPEQYFDISKNFTKLGANHT